MEQIGTVVKTEGKTAYVTVYRTSACGENCAHCKGGCTPTKVLAVAENDLGAKVSDTVKIESETKKVIQAELVLYFVPLVLMILAACILSANGAHVGITVLFSVLSFIAPFFVIKKYENIILPIPKITKVIKKGTN